MTNNAKTFVLLTGLMALFIGGAFNFILYYFSDRIVLKMHGARVVTHEQAPEVYDKVDRLRQRAGLLMPVVAIAGQEQPNAFATGRSPEKAVAAGIAGTVGSSPGCSSSAAMTTATGTPISVSRCSSSRRSRR